jgi:ABC-2 type transport system permease protein
MNIISLAYYTILRNFRDRKTLSIMLVLPIVLILILGTALSSQFTPATVGTTPVAYLNEDGGEISKQFDELLENREIKEYLEVKIVTSKTEGIVLLEEDKINSFIMIEKGYTERAMTGKKADIQVYNRKSGTFRSSIVQNIVDSFIDGFNTVEAVRNITGKINEYKMFNNIEDVRVAAEGSTPRAIDYYAVAMLVMTLMYGTMYGSSGIGEDIFESKGKRMRSTPIKAYELFAGKILGSILTLFLQALILIAFSKLAYGANWGTNIGGILFISFSLAVLAIGIGIMITMLAKDHIQASRILTTIVPVFTFVSGGYAKFGKGGATFEMIKSFIPNQLGHTAFFNMVYNGSMAQVSRALVVMWIMTGIIFIISALAGRRMSR